MGWIRKTLTSSIGSKVLVALTGLGLLLFVIGHMLGNLQMFLGPEAFNGYAKNLKSMPGLLWPARIGLLGALLVHMLVATKLNLDNMAARPVPYASRTFIRATFASRTMLQTGVMIFAFVVYHLLHFTLGIAHPDSYDHADVYSMVIKGFSSVPIAAVYTVAMAMLYVHLSHGASSLFQTLGFNHPKYNGFLKCFGPTVAAVIVLGFLSIPVAVQLGLLKLPAGGNCS